jgi:protein-disulfide isomerase
MSRLNQRSGGNSSHSVPTQAPLHPAVFITAIVLLAVCTAMSLMLALEHLAGLSLPGCGAGSPCAEASASVWGKVPYVGWPVSFLGLAYFLGLIATWIATRGRLPAALRMLVRVGVIGSVGFVAVMFRGGYVCPYCLVTHIANFAFWALVEFAARSTATLLRPATAFLTTFIVATAVLGLVDYRWATAARAVAEQQMQASGQAILAASERPAPPENVDASPTSAPAEHVFTGRYHLGPAESAIRIVLFMDYMCKGCHLIELELKPLFEQHPELSISVKQWPGDVVCNPYGLEGKHINSCAAARAAEAAGLLHGNDGFWQMHFWLFDHNGRFTLEELRTAATEFGYDPDELERAWQSDGTLQLVKADIAEGFGLGVRSTPAIYVNGMEFKGWAAPLALTRVVEKLREANLPVRSAAYDHPLSAVESYVADWRGARVRELPGQDHGWSRGPSAAGVKIVMWGDYRQPNTALADAIIREFLASHADAQYTFHAYALSPQCNAAAKEEEEYPQSCRAALAACAAASLGGPDAYWKMHEWLLKHQEEFSDEALRAAAAEMGLDPAALLAAMDAPETLAAVKQDAAAGQQAGLQHSPLMFINNKVVPRWLHGEQPMLRAILDAAAGDK